MKTEEVAFHQAEIKKLKESVEAHEKRIEHLQHKHE